MTFFLCLGRVVSFVDVTFAAQMPQELCGALDVLSGERGATTSLIDLLPNEFTTADLIKLRARKGQSVSSNSIKVLLHRWKTHGRIDKVSDGHWKRLK